MSSYRTIKTTNGGGATNVQTFTVNGTWTKPAGAKLVEVIAIGGGGGGGSTLHGGNFLGGGGGGGGAINTVQLNVSVISPTVSITVGTGGATAALQSDGNDGTASTFGSLLTANPGTKGFKSTFIGNGGAGGTGGSASLPNGLSGGNGGVGGGPNGGDGGGAGNGGVTSATAGNTDSNLGNGGTGIDINLDGLPGDNYGGGGAGGGQYVAPFTDTALGAAGANGLVTVITYF